VRTCLLTLACLLFTIEARAQALISPASDAATTSATANTPAPSSRPPASAPVFKAGIDLVGLNVVVTDKQSKFVPGLTANDFAVYEDGVQQDVSFFAAEQVPLDLALLLDTSASMLDKMQTMQQAAIGFAATLKPGDRVTVLEIKDSVKISYPLGEDLDTANQAIRRTSAKGGTALYNGLYLGLKEMAKNRRANGDVRRQAIAVLSDGEDTTSLVTYDDVMELAKASGIAVYTVTLKSEFAVRQASLTGRRYFSQSEFSMKALAQETGARSFFPMRIEELAGVYSAIADELANQYAIGYTSKNPRRDGAFRRVIVRIAERPEVKTRTRSGYVSTRVDRVASVQ
jgi:Ca-activated chloride channel family protein